ncbi:uncharacterized protein LOC136080901 [Hydra vulgaris]|uniref:Uncharacterized protein LOC136080901 n=1 Tax=Hydra vulgaris TaxID=6087 RepID=A0ABM4BYP8_HYDVU
MVYILKDVYANILVKNILILGETGVGKSTWINGIANYLKFHSLEDACNGDINVLIPTSFYHLNKEIRHGKDSENENVNQVGQSATQKPQTYTFPIGDERYINLIDTPGIGDIRGTEKDKDNFNEIIAYVNSMKNLDAVCILLKPNNSRLTIMFRYCIQELIIRMHATIKYNILFCFTHCRSTMYGPGNTFPVLNNELASMNTGIEAVHNYAERNDKRNNCFCFDNEAFRYLVCVKNGIYFPPEIQRTYAESWSQAKDETLALFKKIDLLVPHNFADAISNGPLCKVRGHTHDVYRHITYTETKVEEEFISEDVQNLVRSNCEQTEKLKKQLLIIAKEHQQEKETNSKPAAMFGANLTKNALKNLFPRKKLLFEIRGYFSQDANESILVLYGMSGVGKTHIARRYCEISYNFYQNIVWIDAAYGMLQTSLRNQCQTLGFEVHHSKGGCFDIKVIVEKIHNYYKNEKTLYVFDNVDNKSVKNLSMYISREPNSSTLITSQWRRWSNNVDKMLVDVFSSEEAFAYVKENTKENSNENIRNLTKELGYHPFAITQAIEYINMHKISIENYIDQYRSKPSEILNNNNFPTKEESKSALKAINLVLIKLEETKPFLFKLLNCLSHCQGLNISKQFIMQISNQMKTNDVSLLDEAIGLLMNYSLLNCFDDEIYTIHELTQLACKCFQDRSSSTNAYLDLFENYFKVELNKVEDDMKFGNHFVFHFIHMFRTNGKKLLEAFHQMTTSIQKILVCNGLFEEAIEILRAFQSFNTETYCENNEITLNTKHNIANCLYHIGKYNEALEIYYSVVKIQTEVLGIFHQDTMTTKHSIANCLYIMGRYNEALEICYSVDKIQTEIAGINHKYTMATKSNIANCLNKLGKYNEALEIYYSNDKVQTEILGINHPDTMVTKNNIALCLSNMGKYNIALEIYNSVNEVQTETLGINHPYTMETKSNIAICLNKMEKYIEALKTYYSGNKMQTEILGTNHPDTMTTIHNFPFCLNDMGKYNEALEIYYSVDKIRTEVLGITHPDSMTTKHNIASCLYNMGKYNEALEIYYSIDKIQTEIAGINHPYTMVTKSNIAICLNNMGKYNDALKVYYSVDKIQTEIAGINHPHTMVTKNNIAICLNNMGKYNDALEVYYSVDKMQTKNLGIIHPYTMATKSNIANCLIKLGKYNEALEIYYSEDKIQTEILGINHPDTMVTKNNIAICLNYMGKYNDALEVYYSVDKMQTKNLGINHPDTMATKSNIAICLNEMGNYNEALEIFNSVNKMQTEVLGINHPDTMTTKNNIAFCLNNMGKYNEALEIYYSVNKMQTESLGINHPYTMTTKLNIALCLNNMGKYNEALEIYYSVNKMQTESLGINHPSTMKTKHNIAGCFNNMGKYKEALEIYYSVNKMQIESLGINHPSSMKTKHNIAACLYDMGKYNEAMEIYYSVDKMQTEILGINHPDTMATKRNIAFCLNNMGKLKASFRNFLFCRYNAN